MTPSYNDWIYLAGLADGESCISASRMSRGGIRLQVTIAQADEVFLTELYHTFGVGTIRWSHTKDGKNSMRWVVSKHDEVKWLLTHLRPYLKLKKAQAEGVLRLCEKQIRCNRQLADPLITEVRELKTHRKVRDNG